MHVFTFENFSVMFQVLHFLIHYFVVVLSFSHIYSSCNNTLAITAPWSVSELCSLCPYAERQARVVFACIF